MDENKNKPITIRSYQEIWGYEKRLYVIFDTILPQSVRVSDFVYFGAILAIVIAIHLILKIPNTGILQLDIPLFIIKFAVIPGAVTSLLKYNTLDGKKPIAFFKDYIKFFFAKDKQYEFFRDVTHVPETREYTIQWQCSYRHRMLLPSKRRGKHEIGKDRSGMPRKLLRK